MGWRGSAQREGLRAVAVARVDPVFAGLLRSGSCGVRSAAPRAAAFGIYAALAANGGAVTHTADPNRRVEHGGRGERLGGIGSWVLVGVSCSLLVLYLILHTREIGLILAWLASS